MQKLEDTITAETASSIQGWQVCQWLLAHNFLLTGLELLVEAQEAGQEQDVEALHHFFSDRDKFPPEEVAKFDQEDALDIQKTAKEREERLAVTEYELRLAREDLVELRGGAGRINNAGNSLADGNKAPLKASHETSELAIAEEEAGAELAMQDRLQLNAAVRHYLSVHGYKLSAITFKEEAASAIPREMPGETLVCLLQGSCEKESALVAAKEALAAKVALQERIEQAEAQVQSTQEVLDSTAKENMRLRANSEFQQRKLDWLSDKLQEAERNEDMARRAAKQNGEAMPVLPSQPAAQPAKERSLSSEGSRADMALAAVADALPRLVPHMLINARVEMLPLFMTLIQEVRSQSSRDALAHAMFNVVKKPTAGQRQMIVNAMQELAALIGPGRTAEELLPQCWEQVAHKHAERRILVAECCGKLAPHIAADMRPSLVLSMLQQLASDGDAGVKRAVACSLATLLPQLSDMEKYSTVESILLELVQDGSQLVMEAVMAHLLPAILEWIKRTDRLHSALLPAVLSAITRILQSCPYMANASQETASSSTAELRIVGDQQQRQVQSLLLLFVKLLGPLQERALAARPEWASAEAAQSNPDGPDALPDSIDASQELNGAHATALNITDKLGEALDPDETKHPVLAGLPPLEASNSQLEDAASVSIPDSADDPPASSRQASWTDPLTGMLTQGSETDGSQEGLLGGTGSVVAGSDTGDNQQPDAASDSAAGHIGHGVGLRPSDQDGTTGVGQASKAQGAAFAAWLYAANHTDWAEVQWVVEDAVPQLLQMVRMVPPGEATEGLRRRQCLALQSICKTFGEHVTLAAVMPLFLASASLGEFQRADEIPPAVSEVADRITPQGAEACMVGRRCVLPQLLAGVLPCCGAGTLAGLLQKLMTEASDEEAWALRHAQDFAVAVRFAATFEELQGQLLALLWECIGKPSIASRTCAADLASAAALCLPVALVKRQLMPALLKLANDPDLAVKQHAVEALATLWQLFSHSTNSLEKLQAHLDTIMSSGVHEAELAVIQSLASKAGGVSASQQEYVLQKVLLLLASMHKRASGGRSPPQLQAGASVILAALQRIAACQVQEQRVALHLLAALQALRREADLLEPQQREQLDQLTKQQVAATPAMSLPERAAQMPATQQRPGLSQQKQSRDPGNLTIERPSRTGLAGSHSVSDMAQPGSVRPGNEGPRRHTQDDVDVQGMHSTHRSNPGHLQPKTEIQDRATALRETLQTSEVLAKEARRVLESYASDLDELVESVQHIADRAQALTNTRKWIDTATKRAVELLQHLNTPRMVAVRIRQGPKPGLESFLKSLESIEDCIEHLSTYRGTRAADEVVREAEKLQKEALLLCFDDFQSNVKKHARLPRAAQGHLTDCQGSIPSEELIPSSVVERLQKLVEALLRNGDSSCQKVYCKVRSSVMENTQLQILGKSSSADTLNKSTWPVVERQIQAWIRYNATLMSQLVEEQKIASQIFGHTLGGRAFKDITTSGNVFASRFAKQMLAFRRIPEKAFGMMEMGQRMAEQLPRVMQLLPKEVQNMWQDLLTGFAEEARASFKEFSSSLTRETSTHTVGDGAVHPLAAQTIAFLKRLLTFQSTPAIIFSAQVPTGEEFYGNIQSRAQRQALREGIERLLDLLWNSLNSIAESCKSKALAALFLMNNAHYQLKSIQGSASLGLVSQEWQDACEAKVENHGAQYQRLSWDPLAAIMADDLACADGKLSWLKEKNLIKEKWKDLNAAIDSVREHQRAWSIPDAALRANLRDAIVEDFLPFYKEFWRKYSAIPFTHKPDKYFRHSPEDLTAIVTEELFEALAPQEKPTSSPS